MHRYRSATEPERFPASQVDSEGALAASGRQAQDGTGIQRPDERAQAHLVQEVKGHFPGEHRAGGHEQPLTGHLGGALLADGFVPRHGPAPRLRVPVFGLVIRVTVPVELAAGEGPARVGVDLAAPLGGLVAAIAVPAGVVGVPEVEHPGTWFRGAQGGQLHAPQLRAGGPGRAGRPEAHVRGIRGLGTLAPVGTSLVDGPEDAAR